MGMLGASLAGVALANVTTDAHHPQDGLLRRGASEEDILAACSAAGTCLRACPTHGLQMSLGEGCWRLDRPFSAKAGSL